VEGFRQRINKLLTFFKIMSTQTSEDDDIDVTTIAMTITKRQNQRCVGAAVHRRLHRSSMEDSVLYAIELFDFFDNEQFSAVTLELLPIISVT
jgi:hypothetical protein